VPEVDMAKLNEVGEILGEGHAALDSVTKATRLWRQPKMALFTGAEDGTQLVCLESPPD
jgi:hypothetical protein